MTQDCIFCKIIAGDIPAEKVYENVELLACQALNQSSKGHMLIIPKEHSYNIMSMNPKLGNGLLETIHKVGSAMIKGIPCDGFNTAINFPPVVGEVFHTHIHLIPRSKGDGLGLWKEFEVNAEERALFAEKIIMALD